MKRRRWGLIDGFLLLIIALSVAGLLLRVQLARTDTVGEEIACTIVLTAKKLPRACVDSITPGELFYTADGRAIGRVTEIRTMPSRVILYANGAECIGVWDENIYCDAFVSIESIGGMEEGVFLSEGRYAVPLGITLALYGARSGICWLVSSVTPR